MSFYTTVLNQATISNHYALATSDPADVAGPTGGSVDAIGLVGTGSRYSTSTSLSLAFASGTDPSGMADSGAQLLRATGTLTSAGGTADGVCGTFGELHADRGDRPDSPVADIVADQACYSYRYVVQDSLGNTTTYTSPSIKVETTAPAAPTLSFSTFTNAYWSGTGSTVVFYRSAATTGSFKATAAATDPKSGIAGYAFPALGTNWTSTAGAMGVNTYAWSGAPAAPGTQQVTATNNATLTSAGAPFTLTADNTAPTAGTVTNDASTKTTSTNITFTTGTDSRVGRRHPADPARSRHPDRIHLWDVRRVHDRDQRDEPDLAAGQHRGERELLQVPVRRLRQRGQYQHRHQCHGPQGDRALHRHG